MYQVDKSWDNCKYLHVPRRCLLYKRCISSSVTRSAFLFLFPSPLLLSCLRFADKTSRECLNSMSFIMFIFVLSPRYLLMEDWMYFRVSGSYSSPFLFCIERKNLARYWSSCADSISSKHLSSCSACNQLVNNFTSLFVFFVVLLFFIESINYSASPSVIVTNRCAACYSGISINIIVNRRHRKYRKCLAREAQYGDSFTRGWICIFALVGKIWVSNFRS